MVLLVIIPFSSIICNSFTISLSLIAFSISLLSAIEGSSASKSANALVFTRLAALKFSVSRVMFSSFLSSFSLTSSSFSLLADTLAP